MSENRHQTNASFNAQLNASMTLARRLVPNGVEAKLLSALALGLGLLISTVPQTSSAQTPRCEDLFSLENSILTGNLLDASARTPGKEILKPETSEVKLEHASVSRDGVSEYVLHTRRGDRVALRVRGNLNAPTKMLFLNGIDRDMSQWSRLVSELKNQNPDRTYIQIDLIGQGKTSKLAHEGHEPNAELISYERQVEVFEDLKSMLSFDSNSSIEIVGHSYGGGIAARIAFLHPELVKRLVLIAPYVDKLEEYQPGAGPILMWTKSWFEMFGAQKMYRDYFHMGNEAWMTASWPAYTMFKGSTARLSDVIALTRGIETMSMTETVSKLTVTKVDMIVGSFDEVIPNVAHRILYSHIPEALRGQFKTLMASHEMVDSSSTDIAKVIEDARKDSK